MAFLVENNVEEMAYPASFNMEAFKSIPSYAGKIKYCKEKLGKQLGSGSSRMVFPIDDEKVLKLAMNNKGVAQNEAECDYYLQQIGLFAKIYDTDEDYKWIEMQLARKATAGDFKKFFGYPFKVICAYVDYVYSLYARRNPMRDHSYDNLFKQVGDSDEYYDSIFYMLYEYMANTQLHAIGDLKRLSSWGVVSENGEESLVIIDYGLNDDVAQEYYHFRINENDIAEMVKKAINKLLNEQFDDYYDSPIAKAYENVWEGEILEEFLEDKRNGIPHKQWNLIPSAQYKNLLNRYMQWGDNARIPDSLMDEWIQLIADNLVTLEYMTAFAGHSQYFPKDAFEDVFGEEYEGNYDYEDLSEFLENIGYYDWAQLPDGSDAISDYGIQPIAKILEELSPASTPEDKLLIINRCLDVIHCRGDLASTFIQGGRSTCSAISGINR